MSAEIVRAAQTYVGAGLKLVPVHFMTKQPKGSGWNQTENLIDTVEKATATWGRERLNMGVHLGASGLVSFDPDELAVVIKLLEETSGIDAMGLLNKGWRVSGSPTSGRAIFRIPEGRSLDYQSYGIPGIKAQHLGITLTDEQQQKLQRGDDFKVNILELRAGEKQDILPPSIHPDTRKPYRSTFIPLRFTDIPEAPAELLELWDSFAAYTYQFNRLLGIGNPKAKKEPPPPAVTEYSGGKRSPLEIAQAFSELRGHDFDTLLTHHGYEEMDGKWLAPGSQTGRPGVILMEDERHIWSFHGSDKLNGGKPRDYFDCWRILDHDGDWGAAVRAAKAELGWDIEEVREAFEILADDQTPPASGSPDEAAQKTAEQTAVEKKPFFKPLGELLANRMPPQWLVHNFIPENAIALLVGPTGVGKSFLVLDWAMSIATGQDWMGHPVKQAAVAYMAGEGFSGFSKRCAAWGKHHGVDVQDAPIYFNRQTVTLIDDKSCKAASEGVKEIMAQHGPVGLVVIDTYGRCGGGNEDDNTDANAILKNIEQYFVRRFHTACLFVHHSGHGQDRARGASALPAGVDCAFRMTARANYSLLEQTKQKERDLLDPVAFTLQGVTLDDWPLDEATGEAQASAVLVQTTEGPSTPSGKRKKLSAQMSDALECLKLATEDERAVDTPQEVLDKLGLLACSKVVPEHVWREAFYECPSLSADADRKTKEKAFSRTKASLLQNKLVSGSHGYFWCI